MLTKSKIRKNDTVQVLAGKDKGKRGTVVRVIKVGVLKIQADCIGINHSSFAKALVQTPHIHLRR